jgi:hypothetical protein
MSVGGRGVGVGGMGVAVGRGVGVGGMGVAVGTGVSVGGREVSVGVGAGRAGVAVRDGLVPQPVVAMSRVARLTARRHRMRCRLEKLILVKGRRYLL